MDFVGCHQVVEDLCTDTLGSACTPRALRVHCAADDLQTLEQLCHYITCPVPADERLQYNAAGRVLTKLKNHYLAPIFTPGERRVAR